MMISNRLSSIANFVKKGHRVADIGCDHAYTSIYLVQNKISPSVIAMDINKGPLKKAKTNIQNYKLNEFIELRLSNGLEKLEQNEVDTILISGMGGNLIIDILKNKQELVTSVEELVLSPQSDIYRVRKYLSEIDYTIVDENMVFDDKKYYNIIKAVNKRNSNIYNDKNQDNNEKNFVEEHLYVEEYLYYGRILLNSKNKELFNCLQIEKGKLELIRNKLENANTSFAITRKKEISEELALIQRALDYYI